jgi:hypothetical protein
MESNMAVRSAWNKKKTYPASPFNSRGTHAFPSKQVDFVPPTSLRLAAAPMLLLNPITENAHHHLSTGATNMLFMTVVAKLVGRKWW